MANAVFNSAALGFSLDDTHSCHLDKLYQCAQIERSKDPLLGYRPGGTWRGQALRGNKAKEPNMWNVKEAQKYCQMKDERDGPRATEYLKR